MIESGEPNRDGYVKSFNDCLRDGSAMRYWFTSVHDARVTTEVRRRRYNGERPKRSFGGLKTASYAKQANEKAITMCEKF